MNHSAMERIFRIFPAIILMLSGGSVFGRETSTLAMPSSSGSVGHADGLLNSIAEAKSRTGVMVEDARERTPLVAGVAQDLAWAPENQWQPILDSMVSAGVRSVRMDFRWYMLEPQKGIWDFRLHDRLVAAVSARGIRILGIMDDVPTWANGQSGPWSGTYPPTNVADWSTFVRTVVGRYSQTVEAWELWNEENIPTFFRPTPDAAKYVSLLQAGYTAAKAADPDTIIVLGGLAGNGVFMGWEPVESRNFLQKIYAAGGGGYFDVVAIHPYVHPQSAGIPALKRFVRDTRAVMNANSDPSPIWLSEMGWPTAADAWGGPTVSEDQMAQWVTAVLGDCSGLGAGVERAYWYNFRDKGVDQTDLENSFGLIRFGLDPKPAFSAFRRVAENPFCAGVDEPALVSYALPTPNPANANCPSGFFSALVDDGPGTGLTAGAFGMEVLLDEPGTRVLAGGLNFGGLIDVGQVGFAGFTIANAANEPQTLNLNLAGSPSTSSTAGLPVRIRIGRRPDATSNITVFEATATISLASPYVTSLNLPPAFYEVTVAPLSGAAGGTPEGQFFFSLTTSFTNRPGGGFQGGAVVGGYHATHPFGGVSGFAGFCLATPHSTSIRVLSRPSYGPTGATDLRLRIQDAQQRDVVVVPAG